MAMSRRRLSPTFFGGLRSRELGGARGAARLSYLADLSSDPGGRGGGVIAVEHSGDSAIPFAISFGKVRSPGSFLHSEWFAKSNLASCDLRIPVI
jgi:denticleless